MPKKGATLAVFNVPRGAGRRQVEVREGQTVAAVLKIEGSVQQGARNGVEHWTPRGWETVSMSYVIQSGDVLRVGFPTQKKAGGQLGNLLKTIFSSLKRRKREPRSRTHRRRR